MTISVLGAACLAAVVAVLLYTRVKPKPRYPPGPRGLPVVGSLFDINQERPWITYSKWAQQYGEHLTGWHFPQFSQF